MNFFVPGPPRGKGRPRSFIGADHRIHVYTDKKTKDYEQLIRECLLEQCGKVSPSDEYFSVRIVVSFPVCKSVTKSKKEDMLLGRIRPDKKPDLDNVAKVVCDALNNVVYFNDKQVVKLSIFKIYAEQEGLNIFVNPI